MKAFIGLLLLAAAFAFVSGTAVAGDNSGQVHSIVLPNLQVQLKSGQGRDKAETYCSVCHSTDYITMQPQFPKKKWGEIVNKMINVFGAPIPADVAAEITAYLGSTYSSDK